MWKPASVWVPVGFCGFLCAITLISTSVRPRPAFVLTPFDLITFLCNLPLVFYFFAQNQQRFNRRIEALEDRIRQLEGDAEE